LKKVEYTDERGRKFLVLIEDEESIDKASDGIPIGPPDIVDKLDLPENIKVRLHNQLFQRGLWNNSEVRKRPRELQGALQAALAIDIQTLHQAYVEYEKEPEY